MTQVAEQYYLKANNGHHGHDNHHLIFFAEKKSMSWNHVIAVGAIALAAKMWMDVSHMLQQHLRLQFYLKASETIVEVTKLVQHEHRKNKRALSLKDGYHEFSVG